MIMVGKVSIIRWIIIIYLIYVKFYYRDKLYDFFKGISVYKKKRGKIDRNNESFYEIGYLIWVLFKVSIVGYCF